MIITRTPYRISFFGGGSDFPCHYNTYGGSVLGTTINKYCWLAVKKPSPFGPKFKLVYSKVQCCDNLEEIDHPAIRECLRYLEIDGVEIHHWGDLPARSGVGSSSAFVVGLLHALYKLKGRLCLPGKLANDAIHIEQEILRETVGSQDQILTAFGGLSVVNFSKSGYDVSTFSTRFPKATHCVNWLEKNLMLFWTGVQRISSDVAASYVPTFKEKASLLSQAASRVNEGVLILTRGGSLRGFGELLDEAWQLKKALGEGISNPTLDGIYQQAKENGAIGGKLLGAGGGGFLLLFVEPDQQERVRQKLHPLTEVPFAFTDEGSQLRLEDY